MTSKLAPYLSQIPIGATADGKDVMASTELILWINSLVARVGGTLAYTNTDLASHIAALDSEALMPKSDPVAQQAMQMLDETRSELLSVRSDCDALRGQISDLEAQFASMRPQTDLTQRVATLEDRFT